MIKAQVAKFPYAVIVDKYNQSAFILLAYDYAHANRLQAEVLKEYASIHPDLVKCVIVECFLSQP